MSGEAAHMHLVKHRLGEGPPWGAVAFPIVRARVRDDALDRHCGVVSAMTRSLAAVSWRPGHALPVGIQENLVRIEPKSALRSVWATDPIGIELSRLHPRHERVPVVVGAIRPRIESDRAGRL